MVNIVIRKLDPSTTIFSAPFRRFNLIPIGGRSTAITLESGKVVLFASTPNTAETESTIRSLGASASGGEDDRDRELVSHIIAFDKVHNLYLADFKKLYPNAKLVGMTGLVDHRKDLHFDIVLPRDQLDAELAKEFVAIPMTGHPNEDIVWYHKPTKTILQADVMFNLPSDEQGAKHSWVPKFFLSALAPHAKTHKSIVKGFSKMDKQGFAAAANRINELDFDRIIPCHGDVIEGGTKAKDAWAALFADFIKPNTQ